MNDKLKTIIVLVVASIVGFAVAETTLRLVLKSRPQALHVKRFEESERGKFTRYDSTLGWAGKAGVEDDFQWPDASHRVRQNSHGFRGAEHPLARTSKSRLLVLGDSFTWGFGVEDDEIFTSVMERDLKGAWEVVNTGVSGYGTDQEYLFWREHGHKWQPDRVLLLITFVTDIADNMDPVRYDYNKPFFVIDDAGSLELTNVPVPKSAKADAAKSQGKAQSGPLMGLLSRSALVNAAVSGALRVDAIRERLEKSGVVPKRQAGYEWEYLLYSPNFTNATRPAWTKLFALAGAINADARARGAELIVAVVPTMIEVYPELWAEYVKAPFIPDGIVLDPNAPIDMIGAWCRENNVGFIDLLPALKEAGKSDPYLYYPINLHWTRKAHEIVAGAILKEMKLSDEGRDK